MGDQASVKDEKSIAQAIECENERCPESVEGDENVQECDDHDESDGDPDDRLGSDLDTLLVLGVEVSHQTCRGLESAVVLLCHESANQGSVYNPFGREFVSHGTETSGMSSNLDHSFL